MKYKVSVYYSTRAYTIVEATDPEDAAETVAGMDWRDEERFTVVDGDAEIEHIEPGPAS